MDQATTSSTAGVDYRFAMPKTVYFGIGAQKSGTSWLNHYLGRHPDVAAPAIKEQNYWRMVEQGGSPGRLNEEFATRKTKGLLSLLSPKRSAWEKRRIQCGRFAMKAAQSPQAPHSDYADAIFSGKSKPKCRAAGEISPSYALLTSDTYRQMADLAENTRFIFIMRDPIKRVEAGIRHGLARVPQPDTVEQADFDTIISQALSGEATQPLALSQYELTIRSLEEVVPQEHIGYFFFETLFNQPCVDEICDFLSISRKPAEFKKYINGGRAKHVGLTAEQRGDLAKLLAPTYNYIRKRFGSDVPEGWATSEELAVPPRPST